VSGIFGIIHLDGRPAQAAEMERMRDQMAHRGPDGSDIWLDGSVGLGQLMLHSTPESLHEALPWKDPESGLVITADARIDNRDELLSKLGALAGDRGFREQGSLLQPGITVGASLARDRASNPIPDSQLILAAYKRWGEACVDHLLGDFAFAIWDPREKKLFCTRDHMGIRPFYYYHTDDLFVFASSALGVVSVKAVPKHVSEQRIADYLVLMLEGADKTCSWFENVWRMPPAHTIRLLPKDFVLQPYWQPNPNSVLELASDEDYTDAFEEVLSASISARLRSHKPTASMLSGGLDSSTIVGIAQKLQLEESGTPFATFSGVSEEGNACRETRYSRMVTEHSSLAAAELRPSQLPQFESRLAHIDKIAEDPFDLSWTLLTMIYLNARENGHVAVMDGIDGDGVASLTTYYPVFLIRDLKLLTANREILGIWKNMHRREYPLWKEYTDVLRPVLVPEFARRIKRSLMGRPQYMLKRQRFIRPDFASRVGLQERLEFHHKDCNLLTFKTTHQSHARRILAPYLTAGIERYGRLAAYCGVEQRQPLLDKRVIEFCISLPWDQKVRNGWSKYGLRRLAERYLPDDAAWRPGWDQISWKFGGARDTINRDRDARLIARSSALVAPFVDLDVFNQSFRQYVKEGHTHGEEFRQVVGLAQFLTRNFR
jgi:asparagine synthase (glutamine-hydrolysing)